MKQGCSFLLSNVHLLWNAERDFNILCLATVQTFFLRKYFVAHSHWPASRKRAWFFMCISSHAYYESY